MYFLSDRRRDEFLACPELVRMGENSGTPVIQLKTTTLSAKYCLRTARLKVAVMRVGAYLLYGLVFDDGLPKEVARWSLVEEQYELNALQALSANIVVRLEVFNEAAVCVAAGDCRVTNIPESLTSLYTGVDYYPFRRDGVDRDTTDKANSGLEQLLDGSQPPYGGTFVELVPPTSWAPTRNHFITNSAASGLISIFDTDEGGQQEALAHWLLDELSPEGAIRGAQVDERGNLRELTDILLTHRYGNVLFESKALSLLSRPTLPARDRLAEQIANHIRKAARQLTGAARNIAAGLCIMDKDGNVVKVERTQHPHLIILIPDLSLLAGREDIGMPLYKSVLENTKGFLHILDPSELLRIAQAGSMIAARGKTTTPMMAFDFWLIRRAEQLVEIGHPYFRVLLRFDDKNAGGPSGFQRH